MLRDQLKVAEQLRSSQEKSIEEANEKMAQQQAHFQAQLNEKQAHVNQQQVHITALADENSILKNQNGGTLKDKEAL